MSDTRFKVGDIVTCVDTDGFSRQLTVGKDYTVLEGSNSLYVYVNRDDGYSVGIGGYYPDQFKLKETKPMSSFVETKTETKVTTTKTVKTVVDHKLDNGALVSIGPYGSLVDITIGAYKKDAERSYFRLGSLRELIGILTEVADAMEFNEKNG